MKKTIYISFLIFTITATMKVASQEASTCSSFYMLPGETFIVSAWVKEVHATQQKTYTNGLVRISFRGDNSIESFDFSPSGSIIDGWQRIIGVVKIPTEISNEAPQLMDIELVNPASSIDCYFDDVRVFPYNSTMKSFVYEEGTQRLVAELDENNYATFYEYDKEGGLIRVKKETEDGVYTIQETRSSTKKEN